MKIYIISNYKDKIQKYKIDDPFLIFFLKKYEGLIPWSNINNSNDINIYIEKNLLNGLKNKIDPEYKGNNYLQDIDLEKEFMQNFNDPQIKEAYAIYKSNPKKAKEIILNSVNEQKKNVFFSWWNYFTKGNDIYSKNPSFSFVVLKSIIDQSTSLDKKSSLPLNEMAVASLYEKIRSSHGNEEFNVSRQYSKEVGLANQRQSEFINNKKYNDSGWILVKGFQSDPENFEENSQKLIAYSIPNGWCTGSGMAKPYLSRGDFYLYVIGGQAKVAIRMEGDKVAEIQGPRNSVPYEYLDKIDEFMKYKNIDPSTSSNYESIIEYKSINENIRDVDVYENFLSSIREYPNRINMLSKENISDIAIKSGIIDELSEVLLNLSAGNDATYYGVSEFVDYYSSIPDNIRLLLSLDIKTTAEDHVFKYLDRYCGNDSLKQEGAFNRFNVIIKNIPKELLTGVIFKKINEVVKGIIEVHPWKIHYIDPFILNNIDAVHLVDFARNHPLSKKIEELNNFDADEHPEEVASHEWTPPNIKDYRYYNGQWISEDLRQKYEFLLKKWEKNEEILKGIGIKDVREIPQVREALINAWGKYIEKNIDRYHSATGDQSEYTEYYLTSFDDLPAYDDNIRAQVESAWHQKAVNDPSEIYNMPEDIADYYQDPNVFTSLWLDYFKAGNLDKLDSYDAKEAISKMDNWQINDLAKFIVDSKFDTSFLQLDIRLKNRIDIYNNIIGKERLNKELADKGQLDLPFYKDVAKNDYEVDDSGNIVIKNSYACFNWYKKSKLL